MPGQIAQAELPRAAVPEVIIDELRAGAHASAVAVVADDNPYIAQIVRAGILQGAGPGGGALNSSSVGAMGRGYLAPGEGRPVLQRITR